MQAEARGRVRRPGLFEELQTCQVFQSGVDVEVGQAEPERQDLERSRGAEGGGCSASAAAPRGAVVGDVPFFFFNSYSIYLFIYF